MTISAHELHAIAQLAYLESGPDDMAALTHEIGSIMDFVDQLQNVDTQGVMPLLHPMHLHQRLRPDELSDEEDCLQQLAAIAPDFDEGLYWVPQVMETGN
ncbi:Asp-tRNA(Asn)/Glu-tRNA(Gln) amidotransferase subunit GatC [Legionella sp. CNM-4043-24]|uniref:Asp-tRNA(Asn)/Glu-tRNA(Gln) amidotransferase subunit GatC n=1 Tax=Legionella sp. CNM-4043-24 TaxID=3421646 RepID=UPI00403AB505